MKRTRQVLFAGLVCVIVAIPLGWLWLEDEVEDGYAVRSITARVISFMETHDGRWPKSWEELQTDFAAHGGVGSVMDLRNRVAVDFEADAEQLRQQSIETSRANYRVIYAHGFLANDHEANAVLYRYFREKSGIIEKRAIPADAPTPGPVTEIQGVEIRKQGMN